MMDFDSVVVELLGYIPTFGKPLIKLYTENTVFMRFFKYGFWIAVQFWLLRAPMVWLIVGRIPGNINLLIHTVPSYLVADFVVGLILAVAGFLVSEGWIWRGSS